MISRMGLSDDDLENLNGEMGDMMNGLEGLLNPGEKDEDGEDDEDRTARRRRSRSSTSSSAMPRTTKTQIICPRATSARSRSRAAISRTARRSRSINFSTLYCQNLTQKARDGKLDRIVGRDVETERVIQILNRRQKNNPCLIGEPGVGKTAIAEGLAQRIVDKRRPLQAAKQGGLSDGSDGARRRDAVPRPV